MQIKIESTPNPATLTFRFEKVLASGSHEFRTPVEAERSPLAMKIFGFPWTESVYLGPDFISVTKQDWVDWEVLAEPLAGLIGEHLDQGGPLLVEYQATDDSEIQEGDSEIVREIKRALNREIRPVVAMDGGDITFAGFDDGVLQLRMKGACSGCPSSQATLKQGVEVRLKELIPAIREVVAL